jgi:para-nitrobenzyl esterase
LRNAPKNTEFDNFPIDASRDALIARAHIIAEELYMTRSEITRRLALSGGAAAILAQTACAQTQAATETPSSAPGASNVVQTEYGAVRGLRVEGVSKFLGIPYGGDTAPVRFQPPVAPQHWSGVRECTAYGAQAPQGPGMLQVLASRFPGADSAAGPDLPDSEDCLFLQVYTQDASPARRRPVMVWLHGGGFAQGTGGYDGYDGARLVKRGDVVVVTLNHRLTAPGYLYLGHLHPDFADSGNAGMLDIVLALQWVRDNISNFGGDPGNVTIFGESGGGSKVSCLMAMPAARGLFHKAIIQSGPGITMVSREDAIQSADQLLATLGVPGADVQRLKTMDIRTIVQAASAPAAAGAPGSRRGLAPVVDGRALPRHPFEPDAPEISRNVPVLIGTTKDEATLFNIMRPDFGTMTVEAARQRFNEALGPRAEAAFELYRSRAPDDQPTYWVTSMETDGRTWINSIRIAERKGAQHAARAFMYRIDFHSPVLNGALRAPHTLDLPFMFDNVERGGIMSGRGPVQMDLAAKMSQAWVNFARTGDPSQEGLSWPAYEVGTRQTMIFNAQTAVVADPNREIREFFSQT